MAWPEPGQLDRPSGMEFDSDDNLYSRRGRVQIYAKDDPAYEDVQLVAVFRPSR